MWSETLEYYDYLPPYLPQFFADAAREIPLSGREDLLDLGCGPAPLALGFAPYVASVAGLDAELPMLEAAQERARQAGVPIRLVHARAEEAPEDLGRFHFIAMGQAYWFMHSPRTRARIERWLLPGGSVLICQPLTQSAEGATWQEEFRAVRQRWSRVDLTPMLSLNADDFFAGTDFAKDKRIVTQGEHRIELEHLVRRALARADTSPGVLGPDAERMAAEIRARLAPHFKDGPRKEHLAVVGLLYRRRGECTDRPATV